MPTETQLLSRENVTEQTSSLEIFGVIRASRCIPQVGKSFAAATSLTVADPSFVPQTTRFVSEEHTTDQIAPSPPSHSSNNSDSQNHDRVEN